MQAETSPLRGADSLDVHVAATALPSSPAMAALPEPALRRGAVTTVTARPGATSLLLGLLAGPSQAGMWCALVGASGVYPPAVAEAGAELSRLVWVPQPETHWAQTAAVLAEGMDVVAAHTAGNVAASTARRLAARARRDRTALVVFGPAAAGWPGADTTLTVRQARWHGLSAGRGQLRWCELDVELRRRGRPRRATVWPYGRPDSRAGAAASPPTPVEEANAS